ncbi:MAG: dihydrofolate reductase family protein [bacterium]
MEGPEWKNSTVIRDNVAVQIEKLKEQGGGDILVNDSVQLVQTLHEKGLVDECRLMVYPTVLGAGKRLFGETIAASALRLAESRPVGDDGIGILIYRPAVETATGNHLVRSGRRWGLAVVAAAACLWLGAAQAWAVDPLRAATTSGHSETRETIPITRTAGAQPRVAISLGRGPMPKLGEGDRLRGLGEVQVTNTCVEPDRRCIGRRYSFSPRASAWLVLARGRAVAGGPGAKRVSARERVTCGQRRPNRNHHCVLVISEAQMTVPGAGRLPCRPRTCFLNLVVAAHHPNARHGNRLIIGADRPDGSVEQGKGRVSALAIAAGADPETRSPTSSRRIHRSVPMSPNRGGGWVSVYSVKLPNLRKGDVITARARQRLDIRGLGNAVFDSNQIVLAQGPRKVGSGPVARRSAKPGPALDEANGFNCTQGPSAYRTPCVSRKVGQIEIKRTPADSRGRPVPLFVNLICRGLIKEAQPKRAQEAKIRRGGYLRVKRYLGS